MKGQIQIYIEKSSKLYINYKQKNRKIENKTEEIREKRKIPV